MPAPVLQRRPQTRPTAAIRQERASASGLTGDVDGELPPAQNTAFWVVFVIMPYKPPAEHNGGSRTIAADQLQSLSVIRSLAYRLPFAESALEECEAHVSRVAPISTIQCAVPSTARKGEAG